MSVATNNNPGSGTNDAETSPTGPPGPEAARGPPSPEAARGPSGSEKVKIDGKKLKTLTLTHMKKRSKHESFTFTLSEDFKFEYQMSGKVGHNDRLTKMEFRINKDEEGKKFDGYLKETPRSRRKNTIINCRKLHMDIQLEFSKDMKLLENRRFKPCHRCLLGW